MPRCSHNPIDATVLPPLYSQAVPLLFPVSPRAAAITSHTIKIASRGSILL